MSVVSARRTAPGHRSLVDPNRWIGRLARWRPPPPLLQGAVGLFRTWHGIDLTEASVPEGGYRSFDEFFTRRLLPGARPIDPRREAILSPADGRVEAMGRIEPGLRVRVKGVDYALEELFLDSSGVERLAGGLFAVVYLSPRDYHRVHFPFESVVQWVHHVPGARWPVNALGWRLQPRVLARNERVVARLEGERHGLAFLAMVAAWGVGHIEVTALPGAPPPGGRLDGDPDRRFAPGAEFGVFHLGSTVVLAVERSEGLRPTGAVGRRVRMGEALWHAEGR